MFAVFLSSKEHRPSLQARSMTRLWTLALLVVLAGCGNTGSRDRFRRASPRSAVNSARGDGCCGAPRRT